MSLMKRRTMTGKRIAAARANGGRSQGPSTREGRGKIQAANLRHGLYSQSKDVVLESLGEDPDEFERLRQMLYSSWPLAASSQPALIDELAVAKWKLHRIERQQEELQIRQALAIAGIEGPPDDKELFNPANISHLRSLENVAFNEFMRINYRLLEVEHAKTSYAGITREGIENKE